MPDESLDGHPIGGRGSGKGGDDLVVVEDRHADRADAGLVLLVRNGLPAFADQFDLLAELCATGDCARVGGVEGQVGQEVFPRGRLRRYTRSSSSVRR